jgi:LuxR family maltose regulon positive regulatory protein
MTALLFNSKSLIRTKITEPALPAVLLRRDKLDDLFNRVEPVSLVLVQAPAGYGKSTWLAERMGSTQAIACWLHLDELDNDAGRFAFYLTQTLHQRLGLCTQTLAGIATGEFTDLQSCLGCLLSELPPEDKQLFLVLEDYQLIHNEQIHQAVQFLLRHRPHYMTIVILSRNLPPIGVAQLRMQGRLLEITARELALSNQEARAYLEQRLPFELSLEAIERANRRVKGWFAPLQLLASTAETADEFSQHVDALSDGNQFLFLYFEELLGSQLCESQRLFLLKTATLERFNAFLIMRISGQPDGQALLGSLLNMGMFIVTLDTNGLWYRYHTLFAVYLRHLQRCVMPESIEGLHQ